MINYYLEDNPLTAEIDDKKARVVAKTVYDQASLVNEMMNRGTMVTRTDMAAALNLLFEVIISEVAKGNSINLPIASFRPGITGRFDNLNDSFDPSIHTKGAVVIPGKDLVSAVRLAPVTKVARPAVVPVIDSVFDVISGTTNEKLTPGGSARVRGSRLKFNLDVAQDGLYFIRTDDKSEVKAEFFLDRYDGTLTVTLPLAAQLIPGTYKLQVRRTFGEENPDLRTGTLKPVLTVA